MKTIKTVVTVTAGEEAYDIKFDDGERVLEVGESGTCFLSRYSVLLTTTFEDVLAV